MAGLILKRACRSSPRPQHEINNSTETPELVEAPCNVYVFADKISSQGILGLIRKTFATRSKGIKAFTFNPFLGCWGQHGVVPHRVVMLVWSLHIPFSSQGQTHPEACDGGLPKWVYYWWDGNYFAVHRSLAQNKELPPSVSPAPGSRSLETSGLQKLPLSSHPGQDHFPSQEIWCPGRDVLDSCVLMGRIEPFWRISQQGLLLGSCLHLASLISSKVVGCFVVVLGFCGVFLFISLVWFGGFFPGFVVCLLWTFFVCFRGFCSCGGGVVVVVVWATDSMWFH